jgi:hypothetical protein
VETKAEQEAIAAVAAVAAVVVVVAERGSWRHSREWVGEFLGLSEEGTGSPGETMTD